MSEQKVKRYDTHYDIHNLCSGIKEQERGSYVRYEDYESLSRQLATVSAERDRLREKLKILDAFLIIYKTAIDDLYENSPDSRPIIEKHFGKNKEANPGE